jgi:hypothetical protein
MVCAVEWRCQARIQRARGNMNILFCEVSIDACLGLVVGDFRSSGIHLH